MVENVINQSAQRINNKFIVLNKIIEIGETTRAALSELCGLSKPSISEIVAELIKEKTILEISSDHSNTKRGKNLAINSQANYIVAIDLGGTKITISMFNFELNITAIKKITTYDLDDRNEFISQLSHDINQFIDESNIERKLISTISIATPGIVNHLTGHILGGSPNLPQWESFNLSEQLYSKIGIKVVLENDVRTALIGELKSGSCQGSKNAMLIGIGTGLGSAFVLDGKLIRGNTNAAGEIGYMLMSRDQLLTNWSNKGALETMCSGSGLAQRFKAITGENLSGEDVINSARENNAVAKALLEELSDYLALSIINTVSVTNPEKVVIYGGIATASDMFLPRTKELVNRHTLNHTSVNIEVSNLGDDAPLIGAAIIGFTHKYPLLKLLPNITL